MPQIREITSEALQSLFRRLLPSQAGFGEDLQATNVITPIIDLTPTAEGSSIRQDLQTALDGSVSSVARTSAGTSTLASTAGFYLVYGGASIRYSVTISLVTSSGTVKLKFLPNQNGSSNYLGLEIEPFVVFVQTGESITFTTAGADTKCTLFARLIADANGTLQNPLGFTPQ